MMLPREPAPRPITPSSQDPLKAPPDGTSELKSARGALNRAGRLPTIILRPKGERLEWTEATFGLGPFSARVILDAQRSIASAEVEVGTMDSPEAVEDALYDIQLPRPTATIPLNNTEPLTISYRHSLVSLDMDVAIGMLGACALYTVALVEELWAALTPDSRLRLEVAGFQPGRGFGADPRALLASEPIGPRGTTQRTPRRPATKTDRFSMLNRAVSEFVNARDWHRHHTPKNLAMALAGETGGVLHEFQWLTDQDINGMARTGRLPNAVTDHIADTLIYLVRIADVCNLDLLELALKRVAENERRFPR